MLSVLWGRGFACMCVRLACQCSERLFVLGGGLEGVYAARGLGQCAWRSPRGPDSPLVPLHFPERIVFFLSEEERPAHWETGPKVGKLMTQLSKCNKFQHNPTDRKIYEYKVPSCCFMNQKESRLTKGTDELSLNCPGDCLDQGGRGETSKQHVVQEDYVEVPKPVKPTKVPQ